MLSRRGLLGTAAKAAAVASLAACARAPEPPAAPAKPEVAGPSGTPVTELAAPAAPRGNLEPVEIPFCSQVLCVVPFEVARTRGYFAAEGLDVTLTYMKG